MRTKRSIEQFLGIMPTMKGHERGQILLIVALAMVGLLVAAGLAVDAGFLMLRKSQFDRAIDAAALSGAPLASALDLTPANTQGKQFLAANGIVITNTANTCDANGNLPAGSDYCGQYKPGLLPGSARYHVVARWNVPLFFLPLAGINNVPLVTDATAEYMNAVDLYASNSSGLVNLANQAPRGPDACRGNGDAFSPPTLPNGATNPFYSEINGVYTYRIVIPQTYAYDKVRVELFDPDHGNALNPPLTGYARTGNPFTFTCGGQQTNCMPVIPGTSNLEKWFARVDESGVLKPNCNGSYTTDGLRIATLFRLYYYRQNPDGSLTPVDLAYYIGKMDTTDGGANIGDQIRTFTWPGHSYTAVYSQAQGSAEALATDLMWVSPGQGGTSPSNPEKMPAYTTLPTSTGGTFAYATGAEPSTIVEPCETIRAALDRTYEDGGINASEGFLTTATECGPAVSGEYSGQSAHDFIIDLINETPDIYTSSGGQRDLYLQVNTLVGASENDFEIWAGPPRSADPDVTAPANVNARQIWVLNNIANNVLQQHSSKGISVMAIGRMTMNMLTTASSGARVDIPLFYLGPEDSGQEIKIDIFDADTGTVPPFVLYFDTIPIDDWHRCFANTNSQCSSWGYHTPPDGSANIPTQDTFDSYTFTVPSETPNACNTWVPFYGGRLTIAYTAGNTDNITWRITLKSRPVLVN